MFPPRPEDRVGRCPACQGDLTLATILAAQIICPHCEKVLRPSKGYLWVRFLICFAAGAITAKLRTGFDWSFLIFVVSFYAILVLFLWNATLYRLFPPRRFEAIAPFVQTLGIGQK